jgi:hypothetical protein
MYACGHPRGLGWAMDMSGLSFPAWNRGRWPTDVSPALRRGQLPTASGQCHNSVSLAAGAGGAGDPEAEPGCRGACVSWPGLTLSPSAGELLTCSGARASLRGDVRPG